MTGGVFVRVMREDDLEPVVALLGALFAQEADFEPNPPAQRAALRTLLGAPERGVVLVAERDGAVVGTVVLLAGISTAMGRDVCWLEDFVVAPEARGEGVGRTILAAVEDEARRRGWGRITLLTDADNFRAQRLYEAEGFTRSPMVVLRRRVADGSRA
jgi:GNAT superfamily N-acetyltransferase